MRKNACSQQNLMSLNGELISGTQRAKELPPLGMDSEEGMAYEAFTGCTSHVPGSINSFVLGMGDLQPLIGNPRILINGAL